MDSLVVIGGGIAGSTCAKVLSLDNPTRSVILISASPVVKMVANLRTIGRSIDIFDVIEQNSSELENSNLKVLTNKVVQLDSKRRQVKLNDGSVIKYEKLCICSGGTPKVIPTEDIETSNYIKCIRDTETAKSFQAILSTSKRILIVGNGGIATELVYEIGDCEIVWVIKDDNFGATFFDSVVSKFFSDFLEEKASPDGSYISKRHHFTVNQASSNERTNEFGVAMGPDWHSGFSLKGRKSQKKVVLEKGCLIEKVYRSLSSIPEDKVNNIVKSSDDG